MPCCFVAVSAWETTRQPSRTRALMSVDSTRASVCQGSSPRAAASIWVKVVTIVRTASDDVPSR